MSSDDEDASPPPQRTQAPAGRQDDEDEFEFEQNFTDKKQSSNPLKKTLDKPFDEVHEVSDSLDDDSLSASPQPHAAAAAARGKAAAGAAGKVAPAKSFGESDDEESNSGVNVSASLDSSMTSPPPAAKGKDRKKESKKDKKKEKDSSSSASKSAYMGKPGNMAASQKASSAKSPTSSNSEALKAGGSSDDDEDEDDESSDEEDEEADASASGAALGGGGGAGAAAGGGAPSQAKLYNAADYAHLKVSSELSDLFAYIGRHKAADIELETKMKPFIPDYIPAVGEIDAFLKVPRPDREPPNEGNIPSDGKGGAASASAAGGGSSKKVDKDALGLVVLDEPAAAQSDPTVLELSLRAVNKQVISRHATVGSIEYASRHTARVQKWIQSIEDVHRKKPPPHVHYARPMPDIEQLMQVWPPAFEEMLKAAASAPGAGGLALPEVAGAIECDVAAFARMVCALMDIPVYDKVTESLHVLFTLYSEFQNHAYFQH